MAFYLEIWRVPQDWEHPKQESGDHIPLLSQRFDEAQEKWLSTKDADHFWLSEQEFLDFCPFPMEEHYLPLLSGNCDCYQLYDDWSAGLPMSPVFSNLESMKEWLTSEDHWDNELAEVFSRYCFRKNAETSRPGDGYFHVIDSGSIGEFTLVSFEINSFTGNALLKKKPSPSCLFGSRVFDFNLYEPGFEDENQRPTWLTVKANSMKKDLVTLLTYLPQADETLPPQAAALCPD